MLGVDIDGLNVLIEKIDFLNDDAKKDMKKILSSVDNIADCYVGTSVDSIYSAINEQSGNLNKISSLFSSYLILLKVLKETYLSQDKAFSLDIAENIKKNTIDYM